MRLLALIVLGPLFTLAVASVMLVTLTFAIATRVVLSTLLGLKDED